MLGSSLTVALLGLGAVQALPATTAEPVKERAPQGWFGFGPPTSSFNPGDPIDGDRDRCNWRENPFCLVPPGSSFRPGKERRQSFGGPSGGEMKEVIAELERRLQRLQNKSDKTWEDLDEIRELKAALRHIAGITKISAPPGTVTTLTPGKRQSDMMRAIRALQEELVALQNKPDRTEADEARIKALKAMIEYTLGIVSISAPPGSGTSFTIGRRAAAAAEPDFDLGPLSHVRDTLRDALGSTQPSAPTFLALHQMDALLAFYGADDDDSSTTSSSPPAVTRRQSGDVIAIGNAACQQLEIMALKMALAGLQAAYGRADSVPANIYLIQQLIASALAVCHVETTFTPGSPVPGGPMRPEKPQPGGPIVPDRPQPGGPIVPDRPSPGGEVKPSD